MTDEAISQRRDRFPAANIAVYLILCALCLVTYSGIRDNHLFNDDFLWLREAKYGMQWRNLLTYRVIGFFRPAVNFTFFVMERVAPGNIPMHYSLNLILHFINCVLVFHIARLLLGSRKTALAAAAVFAVSSVHTGAVLWISARTTLISAMFVLLAVLAFASRTGSVAARVTLSTVFFVLALMAKETAIAGIALLALVFWYLRSVEPKRSRSLLMLIPPSAVSILYLITRKVVMGGFVQQNWGPGWHAVRNVAGGFLYSLYPWPFFSLFYRAGARIPEPANPVLPEIAAVPLIILLYWIGRAVNKSKEFNLAILWALFALVPASLFRYRFFSTASITQNRYYYLSSVGSILLIALLLSALWSGRSPVRRVTAAALFLAICAGYMTKTDRVEKRWDRYTGQNARVLEALVEEADRHAAVETLVIEDPPMAFRYLAGGVNLMRPRWKLAEIDGGREAASNYKPCLYVSYSGDTLRVMRVEQIE